MMTRTVHRSVAALGVLMLIFLTCSSSQAPDLVASPLAASPLVKDLDTWSFFPSIQDGKLYFVEFYVHDCRGCKRLVSTWDALAAAMLPFPDVVVARFNCEQGVALCDKWNVQHTPTLKLFHNGEEVLTYKADVLHLDLLRPFLMKMKDQVLGLDVNLGNKQAASMQAKPEL